MLHPSYGDLMNVVNADVQEGDAPIVNSRYSIVLATAKRARQIVDGSEPMIETNEYDKPLSTAVEELYEGKLKIESHDQDEVFI
ncbi:MAG: DNA-directed RNA polymerase subunit omega [Lachnospiraceae bacterium]|nr:DNA-directed RNA polymerase subunit omega [Lachnospiraceae bacterium]MBR1914210.1 DNA-directed RNA polymerase subunit omega [Lachnospiraceae bacterium]